MVGGPADARTVRCALQHRMSSHVMAAHEVLKSSPSGTVNTFATRSPAFGAAIAAGCTATGHTRVAAGMHSQDDATTRRRLLRP